MGQPGERLVFVDKKEETAGKGRRLTLTHFDPVTKLRVESFTRPSMVCRWFDADQGDNGGSANAGIEFLSSAMLHGLGDGQRFRTAS